MKNGKSFYRAIEAEITASGQPGTVEGRAVVFNEYSVPIYDWAVADQFEEIIRPDALSGCDLSDVLLLVNHDESMIPLARTRAGGAGGLGALELWIEDDGLHFRAVLDIEGSVQAKEAYTAVKNGVLRGMSFCFYLDLGDDEYYQRDGHIIHEIYHIRMISEISIVTYPAYPQTNLSARQARSLENDRAGAEAFIKHREQEELELAREKLSLYF